MTLQKIIEAEQKDFEQSLGDLIVGIPPFNVKNVEKIKSFLSSAITRAVKQAFKEVEVEAIKDFHKGGQPFTDIGWNSALSALKQNIRRFMGEK